MHVFGLQLAVYACRSAAAQGSSMSCSAEFALRFLSRFDTGFDDGPDLGGGPMAKCKWVVSALMGSAWNSLAWSTAVMSSCACSLHEFMLSNPR